MRLCGRLALIAGITLAVSACGEQNASVDVPGPIAMTEEAVGHYCSMTILEHTGPKAQIHLVGMAFPIWFSQVRDAVAFTRSPEEHYEAVVIYVNDMGKARQWDFPEDDTWIDASKAWFVIESRKTGGMGAPEVIPFGTRDGAESFRQKHGGTVVRLDEIPDAYVLGPVDISAADGLGAEGIVQ